MALDTDLQFFRSEQVTNDASNGGRLSANSIPSGIAQNFWPHVFRAERVAGSTKFLKMYLKLNNDANDSVDGSRVFIDMPTPAGDYIVGFLGTDTNTQVDIVDTSRKYGSALLQMDVAAGSTSIVVSVEDLSLVSGNDQIFQVNDIARITSKATPDAAVGEEEEVTITAVQVVDLVVTLTISTPLVNTYITSADSRVSSLYIASDSVQASTTSVVPTGGVTYNDTASPIVVNNQGTVSQVFTLTFTDAINFTVSGDSLAGLPAGSTNANYSVPNPNFPGTNYITIDSGGWGGTPVAGDTLVVTVKQAAIPFWFRRIVPANSGSLANNRTITAWAGESV